MVEIVGNRSDFVEIRSENGWTGQKTNSGRRAVRWGWTGNILWNILSARLRLTSGSAWKGNILGNILRRCWRLGLRLGSARLNGSIYGARGRHSSSTSGRVVKQSRIFRWRVWSTSVSDQVDFCASEFVWMSSTRWNDQNLFLTTLKIRISPKTLLFSDERGSDTNYWWEKPLVVALKHSEGIKHTVLFEEQKLTIN